MDTHLNVYKCYIPNHDTIYYSQNAQSTPVHRKRIKLSSEISKHNREIQFKSQTIVREPCISVLYLRKMLRCPSKTLQEEQTSEDSMTDNDLSISVDNKLKRNYNSIRFFPDVEQMKNENYNNVYKTGRDCRPAELLKQKLHSTCACNGCLQTQLSLYKKVYVKSIYTSSQTTCYDRLLEGNGLRASRIRDSQILIACFDGQTKCKRSDSFKNHQRKSKSNKYFHANNKKVRPISFHLRSSQRRRQKTIKHILKQPAYVLKQKQKHTCSKVKKLVSFVSVPSIDCNKYIKRKGTDYLSKLRKRNFALIHNNKQAIFISTFNFNKVQKGHAAALPYNTSKNAAETVTIIDNKLKDQSNIRLKRKSKRSRSYLSLQEIPNMKKTIKGLELHKEVQHLNSKDMNKAISKHTKTFIQLLRPRRNLYTASKVTNKSICKEKPQCATRIRCSHYQHPKNEKRSVIHKLPFPESMNSPLLCPKTYYNSNVQFKSFVPKNILSNNLSIANKTIHKTAEHNHKPSKWELEANNEMRKEDYIFNVGKIFKRCLNTFNIQRQANNIMKWKCHKLRQIDRPIADFKQTRPIKQAKGPASNLLEINTTSVKYNNVINICLKKTKKLDKKQSETMYTENLCNDNRSKCKLQLKSLNQNLGFDSNKSYFNFNEYNGFDRGVRYLKSQHKHVQLRHQVSHIIKNKESKMIKSPFYQTFYALNVKISHIHKRHHNPILGDFETNSNCSKKWSTGLKSSTLIKTSNENSRTIMGEANIVSPSEPKNAITFQQFKHQGKLGDNSHPSQNKESPTDFNLQVLRSCSKKHSCKQLPLLNNMHVTKKKYKHSRANVKGIYIHYKGLQSNTKHYRGSLGALRLRNQAISANLSKNKRNRSTMPEYSISNKVQKLKMYKSDICDKRRFCAPKIFYTLTPTMAKKERKNVSDFLNNPISTPSYNKNYIRPTMSYIAHLRGISKTANESRRGKPKNLSIVSDVTRPNIRNKTIVSPMLIPQKTSLPINKDVKIKNKVMQFFEKNHNAPNFKSQYIKTNKTRCLIPNKICNDLILKENEKCHAKNWHKLEQKNRLGDYSMVDNPKYQSLSIDTRPKHLSKGIDHSRLKHLENYLKANGKQANNENVTKNNNSNLCFMASEPNKSPCKSKISPNCNKKTSKHRFSLMRCQHKDSSPHYLKCKQVETIQPKCKKQGTNSGLFQLVNKCVSSIKTIMSRTSCTRNKSNNCCSHKRTINNDSCCNRHDIGKCVSKRSDCGQQRIKRRCKRIQTFGCRKSCQHNCPNVSIPPCESEINKAACVKRSFNILKLFKCNKRPYVKSCLIATEKDTQNQCRFSNDSVGGYCKKKIKSVGINFIFKKKCPKSKQLKCSTKPPKCNNRRKRKKLFAKLKNTKCTSHRKDTKTCMSPMETCDYYDTSVNPQVRLPVCRKCLGAQLNIKAALGNCQGSLSDMFPRLKRSRSKLDSETKAELDALHADDPTLPKSPNEPLLKLIVDKKTMNVLNREEIIHGIGTRRYETGAVKQGRLALRKKLIQSPKVDLIINRDDAKILSPRSFTKCANDNSKCCKKSTRYIKKKTQGLSCIHQCPVCLQSRSPQAQGITSSRGQKSAGMVATERALETISNTLFGWAWKHPCDCGTSVCKIERQKIKQEKKRRNIKIKPCVCGSYICELAMTKKYAKSYNRPKMRRGKRKTAVLKQKRKEEKLKEKSQQEEFRTKETKKLANIEKSGRLKQYAIEDAQLKKRRMRKEKEAIKRIKKFKNASEALLLADSAIDIGKLGTHLIFGLLKSSIKAISKPKHTLQRIKEATVDPRRTMYRLSASCEGSAASATVKRIQHRCRMMRTFEFFVRAMESNKFTNYLLHIRDPKKRLKKIRRQRDPLDYECSLYMGSLRKRPCLWIYYLCPWFYPHCVSLVGIWRQFTDVLLFILAVGVWSPCILCTEMCRALMCCCLCSA